MLLDRVLKKTNLLLAAVLQKSETPLVNEAIKQTMMQDSLNQVGSNLKNEIKNTKQQEYSLLEQNMLASEFHPNIKPPDTSTHHIGSIGDQRAIITLQILYQFDIPCSHDANGAFMPRFNNHTPHSTMQDATAHSKIHTNIYYFNVDFYLLDVTNMPGVSRDKVLHALRDIGTMLREGIFPLYERME